jgi:F-box protein 11
VTIKTGGNSSVRRNRINHNGYEGVRIHEGGGGVIEDNDLSDNVRGAWGIARDSKSAVLRKGNKA